MTLAAVPAKSKEHAALGEAVRRAREKLGFSQESLGYASGLHRTYVGRLERGELNPSFGQLLKLSAALDLRPSELLRRGERIAGKAPQRRRS